MQLGEYLPLYEQQRRDLLGHPTTGDIHNNRRVTVLTTWEVSFGRLQFQDPAAAEMMLLLAFFHHEFVWEGLFDLALSYDADGTPTKQPEDFEWLPKLHANKLAFKSAFGRIMSFSLAKRGVPPPNGSLLLHPLVHAWGRDRLPPMKQQRKLIHALLIIGQASEKLSRSPSTPEYSNLKRRLLTNADACIGFARDNGILDICQLLISQNVGLSALYHIACLYVDFGRLNQAEAFLSLVLSCKFEETDRGLLAGCQRLLADVYVEQLNLEKAKSLYEQALPTLSHVYGDEDPQVLAATTGLGIVFWEMRKLPQAREFLDRVLSKLGDSSSTLGEIGRKAGSTLCLVYWHLRLLPKAEECQERVLADVDKDEAADAISTLKHRYRMAIILRASGKWSAAEAIYSDVFAKQLQLLGAKNLDVAKTANALGRVLTFLGQYDRSRELLDFAWKQQQDLKLPNNHLAIIRTLFNTGVLNRELGFYEEALELLERACALQRNLESEPSNDYRLYQLELAILKNDLGQPEDALKILEPICRDQNTNMALEQGNGTFATVAMAQSLLQLGRLEQAMEVLEGMEGTAIQFLNPNHPDKLKYNVTKAAISIAQSRGDKVQQDLEDTIEQLDSVLGTKHQESIRAKALLGQVYLQIGLHTKGLEAIQMAAKDLRDCLGCDHPRVESLSQLARLAGATFKRAKSKEKQKEEAF